MKRNYHITVNEQFDFVFNENDVVMLDVHPLNNEQLHVLRDNTSHIISVVKRNFQDKSYEINIGLEKYHITIQNTLDILIKDLGFTLKNEVHSKELNAPMPGIILDIIVHKGDLIKKGDPMVILEAMKMENTLNAPADGKIKSVYFSKGESVEKGALLIEME
ncbi:MAG: acetyl-CoA carboxylase biotin carboxyl carrier protein subunit [Flavobacteriaceae bacterium]|nr:MAG: acetyl-CoA carboxylase biotin carboxyl carrier protein subunit [Flavobacteriaceae bacterium]